MKVRFLVPRRADDGQRDRLWEFCRRYWANALPDIDIVEGHHDDGPFNRSAAVNRAAAGDWDIGIVLDADVILDPGQVTTAIEQTARTGRAVLPYTKYVGLGEAMTRKVLDGYDGSWESGAAARYANHVSSCVVLSRALWDRIGGFDDRFVGWGHEDRAFHHACRVLGGGVAQLPGTVWHLWHPHSPERPRSKTNPGPDYTAGDGLIRRYYAATAPDDLEQLLAERADDAVLLMVLTDGRRECIAEAIPAAEKMLTGLPVIRKIICDDSADFDYQCWLRVEFPGWEVHGTGKRLGFGGAVRRAWATALASGQPWTFWLEDDFVIDREVHVGDIAAVLTANPHLAQMALRRQAWTPKEIAAGGVVEQHPDDYTDRDGWLEHRRFWTTNPHLVSRSTLAKHEWPNRSNSEALFARQLFADPAIRSGYWGAREDEPWVTHIGAERVGKGY